MELTILTFCLDLVRVVKLFLSLVNAIRQVASLTLIQLMTSEVDTFCVNTCAHIHVYTDVSVFGLCAYVHRRVCTQG